MEISHGHPKFVKKVLHFCNGLLKKRKVSGGLVNREIKGEGGVGAQDAVYFNGPFV